MVPGVSDQSKVALLQVLEAGAIAGAHNDKRRCRGFDQHGGEHLVLQTEVESAVGSGIKGKVADFVSGCAEAMENSRGSSKRAHTLRSVAEPIESTGIRQMIECSGKNTEAKKDQRNSITDSGRQSVLKGIW
jgi:hypothetical protein